MSAEPRLFSLERMEDETGVSGTGRVLDGVVFHTGQVVVCWRTDLRKEVPGYSSIAIYESWAAFAHIHLSPHGGSSLVRFHDGAPVDESGGRSGGS